MHGLCGNATAPHPQAQRLTAETLRLHDTVRELQDSVDRAVLADVHSQVCTRCCAARDACPVVTPCHDPQRSHWGRAQVVAERDAAEDRCTTLTLEVSHLKSVAEIARQQTAMAVRWDQTEVRSWFYRRVHG